MYTATFGWSVAAGACTVLGAVMLFIKRKWSRRGLAFFLGLAAGVMLAVVVFDLLPSGLVAGRVFGTLWGLACGMILLGMVQGLLFTGDGAGASLVGLGYLIMLGVALHDLPEGMAIALGHELKARTGMVIALGVAIHNIPEGMAIATPLLMGGVRRVRILLQVLLVGAITPFGTVLGLAAVNFLPWYLPFFLGLASGVMLYLVLFQLWPEARQHNSRFRHAGFWLGVVLIFTATYI